MLHTTFQSTALQVLENTCMRNKLYYNILTSTYELQNLQLKLVFYVMLETKMKSEHAKTVTHTS